MRVAAAGACLAAALALACARAELAAPPRAVCAGDPIPIRYNAGGASTLTIAVLPGGGPDSAGRADTVRLQLTAERFGRTVASAPTEVVVAARRLTRSVGGRTARAGRDSVSAAFTVPENEAPAVLRIAGVAAQTPRALVVDHGGRSAAVGTAPTAAFDGLPLGGSWTLRAALAPGEAFGAPAHAPPALLAVTVVAACTPSAR